MDKNKALALYDEVLKEFKGLEMFYYNGGQHYLPTFDEYIESISPLPPEAIFIGMAEDKLPVLINLFQMSTEGNVLVEDGLSVLKNIHKYITQKRSSILPVDVVVISDRWSPNNCVSTAYYDSKVSDVLLGLASWAHGNNSKKKKTILLVDEIERAEDIDFDDRQNLRWLSLRGKQNSVLVVASNSNNTYWKHAFDIKMTRDGNGFVLMENNKPLKFFTLEGI